MVLIKSLRWFVVLAVGLPIGIVVLHFCSGILKAMGDEPAAEVIRVVGVVAGVLWLLTLFATVICVGLHSLTQDQSEASDDAHEK